jgi:isochorismate synthase EntC
MVWPLGTPQKPVIVRGLGRFLELRDLARKQQAEQKQREQKVFAPNKAYEPRSYTVPKPFKLSETSKDSIRRRLKVREEMRAKERQECTFTPQTVSSQSRRVLQNMLNN